MAALLKRWFAPLVSALVLVLISLPYVQASRNAGIDFVFGGLLLNPLDGNSYLAKMYAGWRGDWQFTLPYTAEVGRGSFLFIYYIFLGHLARLLGLSLPLVFHIFRLLGAAALLYTLRRYLNALLPQPRGQNLAFVLAALGSGLGWIALPFGAFTADFWVAEAYPFLSSYANPHFPLGLALFLWLLTPRKDEGNRGIGEKGFLIALASLVLSIVSPFGVVLALVVLGGDLVWNLLANNRDRLLPLLNGFRIGISKEKLKYGFIPHPPPPLLAAGQVNTIHDLDPPPGEGEPEGVRLRKFFWVLLGGLPLLLYDFWISRFDPHLASWNAQNLTPSPAVWDVFLSLSPALVLAFAGARVVVSKDFLPSRHLLVWAALGCLLLYLPFGLQRRFMMGLYIPVSALAVLGMERLSQRGAAGGYQAARRFRLFSLVLLLFALPTNLLVLLASGYGIQTHDPMLYLTRDEAQAITWINQNTPADALILASPETGLFLPAYSGRRVIYGHPFETVDAEVEQAAVMGFFQGAIEPMSFLAQRGVDYVMLGPRERSLGSPSLPDELAVVFESEGVMIYETRLDR